MPWLKLTIETNAHHAEQLTDLLERYGASSVSLSACNDEKIFDQSLEPSHVLWQQTQVDALLPHDADMDILMVCIVDRIGAGNIHRHAITRLDDQDWVEDYQKSVSLQWYGERLCICPSWLEPPETDISPIILDPGLAFGTGTHATTRLCLNWLTSIDLLDKTVIDYGCGSGILALAAARLGARQVFAVDIDPQAITACNQNAASNQLKDKIMTGLPDEMDIPEADILVANVLLNPLLGLAPSLATQLKAGGKLGLSGLLANQIEECLATYGQWFTMQAPELENEWALLKGNRK